MSNRIQVNLKAYDPRTIDQAASKIVETIKRTGGEVSGPVPLPTKVEKVTILRAVHKINNPSKDTIEAMTRLDLPSGVEINIK